MNTKHTTGTPDLTAVRSALLKPKEKEQTQWEMVQSLQDAITAARDAGKTVEQMHADITACWAAAGSVDTDLSFLSFLELYRTDVAQC
jgi:hypothetical protein